MRIGVVKINRNTYVEDAIKKLGHTPVVLQINDEDLVKKIKESSIQKWIFTGTGIAVSVLNPLAPQVPMEILKMKDKEFFLICYSMESVLYQMGYPIKQRSSKKKEFFQLDEIKAYRNHQFYTPVEALDTRVTLVNSYRGEVMTVFYKNTLMTQWHPERSKDGIQCLKAWMEY
jgi:imidazoleglycerol phosphate synthase glutamine amidotransferase subunit HisH